VRLVGVILISSKRNGRKRMINKEDLIKALDDTGCFDDIINFYNDKYGTKETMNNIGDAVHFILETLEADHEGKWQIFGKTSDELIEGFSFDNQRLV